MKVITKLGIVLALLFAVIACQKDNVAPTVEDDVLTEKSPVNEPEVAGQTPFPFDPTATDGNDPEIPTVTPNLGTYEMPQVDVSGFSAIEIGKDAYITDDRGRRVVTITWSEKRPAGDHWQFVATEAEADGRALAPGIAIPLCQYEDCSTAIPNAVAHYQVIANQMCQDIYVCIACCSGGHVLYAMLYIQHNCGIHHEVYAPEN